MSDHCAQPSIHSRQGFVYVLRSPVLKWTDPEDSEEMALLKIGATRNHPLRRAKEVSASTGVPIPYELAYYRDFEDAFEAETRTHEFFAARRVNDGREFFAVHLHEVVAFIDSLSRGSARISSAGYTGGEASAAGRPPIEVETPWAALFAQFNEGDYDSLPEQLTVSERRRCQELAARLAKKHR